MTGDYKDQLTAEMRLAFTRATVNFPRVLNTTPIAIAVYGVFSDVFYELKRERRWPARRSFEPFEEGLMSHISALVDRARNEIAAKSVPAEAARGMSMAEAKKMMPVFAGLDLQSAQEVLRCIRNGQNWQQKRYTLLLSRRNLLATRLTADAVQEAHSYFLNGSNNAEHRAV